MRRFLIFALTLTAIANLSSYAAPTNVLATKTVQDNDNIETFSAVCSSGHTLYYNIISSDAPYKVEIVSEESNKPNIIGDLVIPSTVVYNGTTYSVTGIGMFAFYEYEGLTSVDIPNSVTSIGEGAFAYCNSLNSITIPNSVKSIDNGAFYECGIQSIVIPYSVTSIGSDVFSNCNKLESISVDKENPYYDSRNKCNAIIETSTNKLIIGCKNSTIPNSVTSIGFDAFAGCSELKSVTLPKSLTHIEENAFYGCTNLIINKIPNTITSIGESAFAKCNSLPEKIVKKIQNINAKAFEINDLF